MVNCNKATERRVSELEAHTSTLTAANDRLSRSREALIGDAFNAEDLLCAAADRMRRSRGVRSTTAAAAAAAAEGAGAGAGTAATVHESYTDGYESHQNPGAATAVVAVEGLPPHAVILDSRVVGGGVAGSAEFTTAGRFTDGSKRRSGRHGRHQALLSSPHLSASVPFWPGGGGVAGSLPLRSSLQAIPRSRGAREGVEEEDKSEAVGGDGDEDKDFASAVASSAAMDVLKELERMHVGGFGHA